MKVYNVFRMHNDGSCQLIETYASKKSANKYINSMMMPECPFGTHLKNPVLFVVERKVKK